MAIPNDTLSPKTIQEYVRTYCGGYAPIGQENAVISLLCNSHERLREENNRLRREVDDLLAAENRRIAEECQPVRRSQVALLASDQGEPFCASAQNGQMVCLEEFRLKSKDDNDPRRPDSQCLGQGLLDRADPYRPPT